MLKHISICLFHQVKAQPLSIFYLWFITALGLSWFKNEMFFRNHKWMPFILSPIEIRPKIFTEKWFYSKTNGYRNYALKTLIFFVRILTLYYLMKLLYELITTSFEWNSLPVWTWNELIISFFHCFLISKVSNFLCVIYLDITLCFNKHIYVFNWRTWTLKAFLENLIIERYLMWLKTRLVYLLNF